MKKAFYSSSSIFDKWFSYINKRSLSDKLILYIAIIAFLTSGLYTLIQFNQTLLITKPTAGGTFIEGMIGAPRFINPVLAITRVDQDLVSLLFAGLFKLDTDGNLIPYLAESITTSDDGKVYSVVLRRGITFSDGEAITTDDVAYTIDLIKNAELKSPLRGSWNDVEVEIVSETEINFVLKEAYSPFIENLTIGILPKHIWQSLSPEEFPFSLTNTEPVGSGLYTVKKVTRKEDGLISQYELTIRKDMEDMATIPNIVIRFYANESELLTAFQEKEIHTSGYVNNEHLSSLDASDYTFYEYELPRVFGLFINQNKNPVLRDSAVREALEQVIDREVLTDTVLQGWGKPTAIPIPTGFHGLQSEPAVIDEENVTIAARRILENGGWQTNTTGGWEKTIDATTTLLTLNLSIANNPYFEATATYLKDVWEELGISVTIEIFEQADLVQTVIRPRNYEMVLTGNDVGRSLDLFPFWHSSQREDPGLNIALYTNISADDTLEAFRSTRDTEEQNQLLKDLTARITAERPAIFLYNPSFVYVVEKGITITPTDRITKPSDRFATVSTWYLTEDSVWPLFNN